MLLVELWPEHGIELYEAGLKGKIGKLTAAGILGAGLLGGYGDSSNSSYKSPNYQLPEIPLQVDGDISKMPPTIYPKKKEVEKRPPGVHDKFPKELIAQSKLSPNERITRFVDHFLPYIDAANDRVLSDRKTLISIINQGHTPAADEQQWIDNKSTEYNAKSIKELLMKIDEVPRSMALAQAAVESGWGTSDFARQGNAFYGQITGDTKKHMTGPDGQKFGTFDEPSESVQSYINNLNTHPAYSNFRQHRFQLRKEGKKLDGHALIGDLDRYSTRKQAYINDIRGLINSQYFKNLDKTQD